MHVPSLRHGLGCWGERGGSVVLNQVWPLGGDRFIVDEKRVTPPTQRPVGDWGKTEEMGT